MLSIIFLMGKRFIPILPYFFKRKKENWYVINFSLNLKANFLQADDQWKADFMRDITTEFKDKLLTFESTKYRLVGLPFYNEENENPFWDALNAALTTN